MQLFICCTSYSQYILILEISKGQSFCFSNCFFIWVGGVGCGGGGEEGRRRYFVVFFFFLPVISSVNQNCSWECFLSTFFGFGNMDSVLPASGCVFPVISENS